MAPDVVVAPHCCYLGAVSTSFSGKIYDVSRPWIGIGFDDSKSSVARKNMSISNETSFWGAKLRGQGAGAFAEKDLQPCCTSRLVVSASSSPPKPPIFVLKKPQRKAPVSDEDITPKTSVLESIDGEVGHLSVSENHKSGYVALIGKPNVGKSTLLNQIIGQKLSIVTNKPQTTRHRILGICSTPDYQMVLYDTPGVLPKAVRRLDEMMMQNVKSARINADCVLLVVDACQEPEQVIEMLGEGLQTLDEKRPTLMVLNKMDLIKPGEIAKKTQWYQTYGGVDAVLPVSAKFGHGVNGLKAWAVDQLPKGPAYYPKDIVSEHTERFFVSEIVREKIFLQYRKEIPYVSQVNVLNYTERRETAKDFIEAEIVVERESQMGILIGKDGAALKLLATASRLDIEEFVGKQVFLELKVKVRQSWREDEELLDYYGYNSGKIRI